MKRERNQRKITELQNFLHSNNVKIAAILETKLTNKTKPLKTPGWAAVRLDRHKNNGGGLLMLIKDKIPYVDHTAALPQTAEPHLEQKGIYITMPNRQQLHIHIIYIPPRSSCYAGHNASIAHHLSNNEMSLTFGDINAHHSRRHTDTNVDERGEQLADEIDAADYIILNENEATRIPTNGRSTSPDNSLASNDIALLSDWTVSTSLASDHLPILITINSELSTIDGPQRTYINFKKADRVRYAEACDEYLAEAGETRTVEQTENTFRKAVNMASGLFIPAGRIRHFQQTLPASTKSLADERDRKLNPADEALNDLNKQIQLWWWKKSEPNGIPPSTNATIEEGISHLCRFVKGLRGKKRTTRSTRASGSPTRPS